MKKKGVGQNKNFGKCIKLARAGRSLPVGAYKS